MPTAPHDMQGANALPTRSAPASGVPDGAPCGAVAVPAAHAFSEAEQRGVYRAIHERRDMRHFSGGSVAPVALLCLGPVEQFYEEPMLQRERWAQRAPLESLVFDNTWGEPSTLWPSPEGDSVA